MRMRTLLAASSLPLGLVLESGNFVPYEAIATQLVLLPPILPLLDLVVVFKHK